MGFLQGKKTYIIAGIAIIGAVCNLVLKLVNGEPVTVEDVYLILGSAGLGTLRAGTAKK